MRATMIVVALFALLSTVSYMFNESFKAQMRDDTEWHEFGRRMRRWHEGKWEYRPMTAEELKAVEDFEDSIW